MKNFKLLVSVICLAFAPMISSAKVKGTVKKEALIRQLGLSLEKPVKDLGLPDELASKLPVRNDLTEINPVFINAWTQLSFIACSNTIKSSNFATRPTKPEFENWLSGLIARTTGRTATDDELKSLMDFAGDFPPLKASETIDPDSAFPNKLSMVCSLVLSSPEVYLINL